MPIFHYKAKMRNAETVLGHIDAETREQAVEKINQMGLTPVLVEDGAIGTQMGINSGPFGSPGSRPRSVSTKEVYSFSRQLANLIKSGIPILRTLELIAKQMKNPYFKKVVETIYNEVKDGKSFSDCLADYPRIFSNFYVTMVKAGEESGNLKGTVTDVANYLQEQEHIRSKVRTAVAYPIFMGVFGLGTVAFILISVMPKITSIFETFDQALPMPTQIVMGLSDFLIHNGLWVVIAVIILITLIKQWDRTKEGRIYKSQVMLAMPMFGEFLLKVELARFCRTLQMLLKSGIPIVRALQLSIPVVENQVITGELQKCQDDLVGGRSLGQSLKEARFVPPMLGDLISVGEESGSLSSSLNDISETYEQDTNEFIKLMTTLLEPTMILTVPLGHGV